MIPPNCLYLRLKRETLPHQYQVEEALLTSKPACQHCPPGTEPEEQASDVWVQGRALVFLHWKEAQGSRRPTLKPGLRQE